VCRRSGFLLYDCEDESLEDDCDQTSISDTWAAVLKHVSLESFSLACPIRPPSRMVKFLCCCGLCRLPRRLQAASRPTLAYAMQPSLALPRLPRETSQVSSRAFAASMQSITGASVGNSRRCNPQLDLSQKEVCLVVAVRLPNALSPGTYKLAGGRISAAYRDRACCAWFVLVVRVELARVSWETRTGRPRRTSKEDKAMSATCAGQLGGTFVDGTTSLPLDFGCSSCVLSPCCAG